MKLLESKWIEKEFEFEIIMKIGLCAIAQKNWRKDIDFCKYPSDEPNRSGVLVWYEICIIKENQATKVNFKGIEVEYDARQSWATTSDWGKTAFSARTIEKAEELLIKLIEIEKKRKEEKE